ncbi:rhodanese-like domain-containing protein [Priestia endophytica]|uniref:rhodanese-like domain-containing protein n=1 Tax=Priestia endophytica TaxID=135735 RepID=UPI00228320BD|nr:rhodanese-like domain-containing protein [Priestia endophytica]MCY8232928.1 rhodanese-like domain-containing protein [Priestia endophytica]
MEGIYVILILLGAFIVYSIIMLLMQRRIMKSLTEAEFRAGYRKAQLIDIREQKDFEGGHILGARNIPLSQLKMRIKELRPDQPVYLYDQAGIRTGKAAQMIRRHRGIKDIYQLKGGFKLWTGKVKTKKK